MSKNHPTFSVIIPVKNAENYIRYAIESVFKQDFQNFEIIVINDGSTDNTKGVVEQLLRKNIDKLINHKTSRGTATARNTGAKIANGRYLAFLDADDTWYSCFLSTCINTFKSDTSIKLVTTDFDWIDQTGTVIKESACHNKQYSPKIDITHFSAQSMFDNPYLIPSVTSVDKISFLSINGFNKHLYCEDLHFWLIFSAKFKCVEAIINGGSYRQHNTQKTKFNDDMFIGQYQAYKNASKHIEIKKKIPRYTINKKLHDKSSFLYKYFYWESINYKYSLYYSILSLTHKLDTNSFNIAIRSLIKLTVRIP
jgi:glycosyltransferase involved in cell wall biosynthesis